MDTQKNGGLQQRVLLVDDEEGVRHSWNRYLSEAGYDVDTAEDGEKAIRRLRQKPVDVVISDLKMPGADGMELLRWLNGSQPDTRFILLTGHGDDEVEQRVRELGAFEYLEKPVSPEALSMVVTAALLGGDGTNPPSEEEEVFEVGTAQVTQEEAVATVAAEAPADRVESEAQRGRLGTTLEVAGWLVAAPILGLAFVVFLPVIGFGAVVWTLAETVVGKNRPART